MKSVYTLVDDIYKLMETKEVAEGVDLELRLISLVRTSRTSCVKFGEKRSDNASYVCPTLGARTSTLWNVYNDVEESDDIQGHTYVKFLYGHLIEEMLLFLTRVQVMR